MTPRTARLALGAALVALVAPTTISTSAAAPAPAPASVAGASSVAAAGPGEGRYATPVVAAHPTNAGNPLAGRQWGVYTGALEPSWTPYQRASGRNKQLIGEIALRPKAKWFVRGQSSAELLTRVREYVANSQAGDDRTLVQMALFGMRPWGGTVCRRGPTVKEQRAYRTWIRTVARGIDDEHTAVVLQPDLMVARCGPRGGRGVANLVAWATRTLSALPHTSVYIDAGAGDWPPTSRGGAKAAADYLVRSGVRSARGFALNGTHYSPMGVEVRRAAEIAGILGRRGMPGKRAVISTSSNGKGFEFGKYRPQSSRDNARTCARSNQKGRCVMLGIPPSMDVDAPRWGLPASVRRQAARHVDGYLWFGRPWLYNQASPFLHKRAYALARSWRLKPR